MPWIIASQTIPILAIAPMIIVVLGNLGLTGLAAEGDDLDVPLLLPGDDRDGQGPALARSAAARPDAYLQRQHAAQVFWKLRWPAAAAVPVRLLKVAIAISLVGAIVGELPTGATAGLGARLLTGSYYGQTVQIWSALLMAALLGCGAGRLIGVIERLALGRDGGAPVRRPAADRGRAHDGRAALPSGMKARQSHAGQGRRRRCFVRSPRSGRRPR